MAELHVETASVASPEAVALRRAYAAEVGAVLGVHFEMAPDADLAPPAGEFWLARLDGVAVGCLGVRLLGGRDAEQDAELNAEQDAELKRLFTTPAARGHGAARALMAEAEAWARGRGAQRLVLDTRSELTTACALYPRLGFDAVEAYNPGATPADRWFAKVLG